MFALVRITLTEIKTLDVGATPSDLSMVISVVGLAPFLIMIVAGASSIRQDHVFRKPQLSKVEWGKFLTVRAMGRAALPRETVLQVLSGLWRGA